MSLNLPLLCMRLPWLNITNYKIGPLKLNFSKWIFMKLRKINIWKGETNKKVNFLQTQSSEFNFLRLSEIHPRLHFESSKRVWVANGMDFKRDLKSGSPAIRNPDKWPAFCQKPFEIRTKTSRFWKVWYSKGYGYSFSHSPTIWKPDHLKSNPQKVWISNVSGIQISTVYIITNLKITNEF